jgi:hypothetical protein
MPGIIVLFITIPLIPGYYRFRGAYQNLRLKNVPIPVVLMFSIPLPIFAFINSFFTDDLLFSTGLLIYGVLFAVLAFRFR